jgi:uncharacterized protein YaiL (DUF2058 family)
MSNSLRDALRQAGVLEQFRTHARREGRQAGKGKGGRTGSRPAHASARPEGQTRNDPRQDEEIDLARAYALRAQAEQREREEKARAEREAAERRRRQREQIAALVEGRTLNRGDAEVVRNFEYGGKIRRVYVTEEQLDQVNDGRLGVVQMRGHYLLVERALAEEVRAIDPNAVALLVDPE